MLKLNKYKDNYKTNHSRQFIFFFIPALRKVMMTSPHNLSCSRFVEGDILILFFQLFFHVNQIQL